MKRAVKRSPNMALTRHVVTSGNSPSEVSLRKSPHLRLNINLLSTGDHGNVEPQAVPGGDEAQKRRYPARSRRPVRPGNYVNYHVGNEHFRSLVKKHKIAYVACPKPEKGRFSTIIVDEVRSLDPPGRFLKQDPKTKLWQDIGDKKSLDKTRQALREGAPELLKELVEDDPKVGVWLFLILLKIHFCSFVCFFFVINCFDISHFHYNQVPFLHKKHSNITHLCQFPTPICVQQMLCWIRSAPRFRTVSNINWNLYDIIR